MTQTSGAGLGTDKPFFRYDLQTEAVQDGGQRFVDVTDPNAGTRFRFFEVEYAVACGMDGERDLAALVAWAKSELDLKTTTAELGAIVSKLSELEYLGASAEAAPLGPPPDVVATMPEIAAAPERGGIDVELGYSGKSPIAAARPEAPVQGDFELGMAGGNAPQRPSPSGGDAMLLGAAGNENDTVDEAVSGPSKEVSTDLSQTFRIDKDEVKAAVRASKVMNAVDPAEFEGDELTRVSSEATDAAAAEAALAAKGISSGVPENVAPISDISDSIDEEVEDVESGGAAIVLPEEPAKIAASADSAKPKKKKKKLGPKRNSASYVLWVLLLLVLAAGGVYYYMEYIREQPEEKGPSVTPQQFAAKQKAKNAAAGPKAPTGTLKVSEAPSAEVAASRSGVVNWVAEASSEIAEGDEIVKFSGHERTDKAIERHVKSLASYEAQLAAAQGKSASRIASIESNVARKKLDIELATKKRNAFIIKAPITGVIEVLLTSGARVKSGAVIAKITGTAMGQVGFALPKGMAATVDDELEVVAIDDAELKATCVVTEAAGQNVALGCPADSGLADGTKVQLSIPEAP